MPFSSLGSFYWHEPEPVDTCWTSVHWSALADSCLWTSVIAQYPVPYLVPRCPLRSALSCAPKLAFGSSQDTSLGQRKCRNKRWQMIREQKQLTYVWIVLNNHCRIPLKNTSIDMYRGIQSPNYVPVSLLQATVGWRANGQLALVCFPECADLGDLDSTEESNAKLCKLWKPQNSIWSISYSGTLDFDGFGCSSHPETSFSSKRTVVELLQILILSFTEVQ